MYLQKSKGDKKYVQFMGSSSDGLGSTEMSLRGNKQLKPSGYGSLRSHTESIFLHD
jgi:hypothetical protein